MTSRAVSVLVVIVFIPLLISSCATQMTLEEAKKVTITTTEKSFVPPPRKANDINDLLKKKGIFESKETASLTRKADMKPPTNADDLALKQFYEERGLAAYQLVRYNQALEDLRKAYGYQIKTGGQRNLMAIHMLSFSESEFGNYKAAIIILEEEIPKNQYTWTQYSYLTQLYAMTGDVESARKMNKRCNEECAAFKQKYPRSMNTMHCEAQVNRSNGWLLQAEGKFDQSEEFFRSYLDYWVSQKDARPRDAINMRIFVIGSLIKQGKLIEAELEARKALDQSVDHAGKDSALTGKLLTYFVSILRLQGRLQEAEGLSKEAIRILEVSQVPPDSMVMSNAYTLQGNILFAQDDYSGVMNVYDQVKG